MAMRTHLIDNELLYLFSYDADLEMRRDIIGFVPGGVRVNISALPEDTRVFNVARERTIQGSKSIQGTVLWGEDMAIIRTDDVAVLNVRLAIQTDDGATIFSRYRGVFPCGPRGFRKLISEKPLLGSEDTPFVANVYVTPRYETSDPRYTWLMKYQCVGYGAISVVDSQVRDAKFDIYAMDA
jgi:Protein of unknown function (DUF3237)